MSLETKLIALAQAVGADIKAVRGQVGDLSSLPTTAKASLVAAVAELFDLTNALIDDAAAAGTLDATWSADKIHEELTLRLNALRDELTDGASAALNTFRELSAAMGDDPNFAQTIATGLSTRVRFDEAQVLSAAQKLQACQNIGIGDPETDFTAAYVAAKA